MEKPNITAATFSPLFIQKYERYLPTAFDESMTILEKVNKVIIHLNQIGQLTNDVVEQWNQTMEWIISDGISETIEERLNAMEIDGSLAQIINEVIFEDLNNDIQTVDARLTTETTAINTSIGTINESLTTLDESLTSTNEQLSWIGKSVKFYGAKGDYIDDSTRGTNDTQAFQTALNEGGILYIPKGHYYVNDVLHVKSNTRLVFSPDATLHTYAEKAFSFALGVENVRIEQYAMINHYSGTSYAFHLNGNYSDGYNTCVKNIFFLQGTSSDYTWAFYWKAVRKATIDSYHGYTKNGLYYDGGSAENVITNCNFINSDELNLAGTKGLYSTADIDGRIPEGLSVKNTLFFHYERNIHIRDLFVGFFRDLYLDCGATGCLDALIEYNLKTYALDFSDMWVLRRGISLGVAGYDAPKEFRSRFTNITFDNTFNEGFHLEKWVREIEINNMTIYADPAGTGVGLVSYGENNFLKVNNFRGRFLDSNIQIGGPGAGVELNHISNYDNLGNNGFYFPFQTVKVDNVDIAPAP